jgi:hypothetical protein
MRPFLRIGINMQIRVHITVIDFIYYFLVADSNNMESRVK